MHVSDGVISADEAKAGGADLNTWLPAGEVYGLVQAGSAEGKVVLPKLVWRGQELKDFAVTLEAGKVAEITAKPSKAFDEWKALYDAAPAGKEIVSVLDFGINTDVKAPKGKALQNFVPAGTVTLMIGGDLWAGGSNTTPWAQSLFLTDATLTADGKTVVDKGALKVEVAAK